MTSILLESLDLIRVKELPVLDNQASEGNSEENQWANQDEQRFENYHVCIHFCTKSLTDFCQSKVVDAKFEPKENVKNANVKVPAHEDI